jgi:hypothetical protein
MRNFISLLVALGLAVVFTAPAFATDKTPTTKAACLKAHMHWNATTKKCS